MRLRVVLCACATWVVALVGCGAAAPTPTGDASSRPPAIPGATATGIASAVGATGTPPQPGITFAVLTPNGEASWGGPNVLQPEGRARLLGCYASALKGDPSLAGTAFLIVDLRAKKVVLRQSSELPEKLKKCLVERALELEVAAKADPAGELHAFGLYVGLWPEPASGAP